MRGPRSSPSDPPPRRWRDWLYAAGHGSRGQRLAEGALALAGAGRSGGGHRRGHRGGRGRPASGRACAATVSAGGTVSAAGTVSAGGTVSAAGTVTGTATHYVLAGTGNCSPVTAGGRAVRGAVTVRVRRCRRVRELRRGQRPDGSVTAEVIDQCPPCAAGHVDLSEAAFSRIAPLSAGLVPVSYRTVADPALARPISLRVKEGSSPYWLALLVQNTGNPLASVQVASPSGGWQNLARADYNYWLAASRGRPFTVRDRHRRHRSPCPASGLAACPTPTPMYARQAAPPRPPTPSAPPPPRPRS